MIGSPLVVCIFPRDSSFRDLLFDILLPSYFYVELCPCRGELKKHGEDFASLATKQDRLQQFAVQTSEKVERELGLIRQDLTRRSKKSEEAMKAINMWHEVVEHDLQVLDQSIKSATEVIEERCSATASTTAQLFSLVIRLQNDVESLVVS